MSMVFDGNAKSIYTVLHIYNWLLYFSIWLQKSHILLLFGFSGYRQNWLSGATTNWMAKWCVALNQVINLTPQHLIKRWIALLGRTDGIQALNQNHIFTLNVMHLFRGESWLSLLWILTVQSFSTLPGEFYLGLVAGVANLPGMDRKIKKK
jgi:hypothetical protein